MPQWRVHFLYGGFELGSIRTRWAVQNPARAGSWAFIRKEFDEDWNSLVVDVVALENQLYE
jgi:hypothetical protein